MNQQKIPGRSSEAGTFAEGYLRIQGSKYKLRATRTDGVRFGSWLTNVRIEGEDISPGSQDQIGYMNLDGLEFRLSNNKLDLRSQNN